MDEAIWAVIGIFSVIIGISVISLTLLDAKGDFALSQIEGSLDALQAHCDQICQLPVDTAVSVDIRFSSDIVLSTNKDAICILQDDEKECRRCDCVHQLFEGSNEKVVLNLTDAFLSSHTYACRYTRVASGVSLECAG